MMKVYFVIVGAEIIEIYSYSPPRVYLRRDKQIAISCLLFETYEEAKENQCK